MALNEPVFPPLSKPPSIQEPQRHRASPSCGAGSPAERQRAASVSGTWNSGATSKLLSPAPCAASIAACNVLATSAGGRASPPARCAAGGSERARQNKVVNPPPSARDRVWRGVLTPALHEPIGRTAAGRPLRCSAGGAFSSGSAQRSAQLSQDFPASLFLTRSLIVAIKGAFRIEVTRACQLPEGQVCQAEHNDNK